MASNVTVDFNANLARFSSAIDKATSDLNRFQTNASRISGNINKSFGALGVGLSVAGVAGFLKGTIDALDRLNDLNKTTGISVEVLSGLSAAAKQSGSDLEGIAQSINKLSVNIGSNEEKFRKLGISSKDPLEAFKQLADIFVKIQDPQQRAAFAAEALGKSWQGAAPLLAEGGRKIGELIENGTRAAGVSKEMAERADAFNDQLEITKIKISALSLPFLNLINDLTTAATAADGFWGALAGFKTNKQDVGKDLAEAEGRLKELSKLRSELDPNKSFANKLNDAIFGDIRTLDAQIKVATQEVNALKKLKQLNTPVATTTAPPPTTDPALARKVCEFNGGTWDGKKCIPKKTSTPKDDPAKQILDNTLASLERSINAENSLLSSRNKFIELFNSQNLLSIREYYQSKNSVIEESLQKTLASYDKEISALEAFKSKSKKQTEREEAQGKINALLEKKNNLTRESTELITENAILEKQAMEQYSKEIQEVNIRLLEMSGNLRESASLRFDQSVEAISKRFTAEGNARGLEQLETLRKYTIAQAELNELNEKAGIINDQLANKEARIDIARSAGATSELGTLRQISEARKQAIAELQKINDNYESIAKASGNPRLIQDAENRRVELEKLAAQSDLVAQKFETIFVDSFSDAFSDFVTGAKSAEEAFNDFANSVTAQITRLAAQDLATSLYGGLKEAAGGNNFLSGIGDFFSGLFNANGNAFNQSGVMAFANGGIVSSATPFSFGGGKLGVMGEAGPEAILPLKRGSNGQLGVQTSGGNPIVINQYIQTPDANSFRKSQPQIMADMQRNLNRGRRVV